MQSLPEMKKQVFSLEQKLKMFQGIDELRRKLEGLKDEMAWAAISEKEKVSRLTLNMLQCLALKVDCLAIQQILVAFIYFFSIVYLSVTI